MQSLLAITWLTWKAAFRFRLFIVVAVLLLATVVGLPILIKDDGTARGFTQILLAYTLSTITALLGLSTLWLACGTLARDIEECQIQMIAVKPVARWQIWLGKWLGIVTLNAALLAISGFSVYGLLQWRATKLPEAEQKILRNEVLVARGSAREPTHEKDLEAEASRRLDEALAKAMGAKLDVAAMRRQILEALKAELQVVPPGYTRPWQIDLGFAKYYLRDQPLYLRVKFNAAEKSPSGTFDALWMVGVPEKTKLWRTEVPMSLAPDTFHEFQIPANLFDEQGVLTILFVNPNNTALLFPLDDGMEVLYREGGFGLNFARGLGIIFCWMILLTTLGLAAASFLSFPVAAFATLAVLMMSLSTGTLASAVEQGTVMGQDEETGQIGRSPVDAVAIPFFRAALRIINLAKDFSPIDSLSSGRSITWTELGKAFGQIVLLLGGIIAMVGIWSFSRRELATAQGTQ
ncbi:MAG: ABC transporter permease [Verrucomicrobia subdivision 3 bacterium]|nr:ABC transporter permease [Limisphaerales bacterium]